MTEAATIFGMAGQVVVILAGLAAAYLGFKRWVRKTVSTEDIERKLDTGNGKEIGELVQQNTAQLKDTAKKLDFVQDELNVISVRLSLTDRRLDQHLLHDHVFNPAERYSS